MGWPELREVTTNRMEAENTNKRGVEMEKPYKLHMQQSEQHYHCFVVVFLAP